MQLEIGDTVYVTVSVGNDSLTIKGTVRDTGETFADVTTYLVRFDGIDAVDRFRYARVPAWEMVKAL